MLGLGLRAALGLLARGAASPVAGKAVNGAIAGGRWAAANPNKAAALGLLGAVGADTSHTTPDEADDMRTRRQIRNMTAQYTGILKSDPTVNKSEAANSTMAANQLWKQFHDAALQDSDDYETYTKQIGRVKPRYNKVEQDMSPAILTKREFDAMKNGGDWGLPFTGE